MKVFETCRFSLAVLSLLEVCLRQTEQVGISVTEVCSVFPNRPVPSVRVGLKEVHFRVVDFLNCCHKPSPSPARFFEVLRFVCASTFCIDVVVLPFFTSLLFLVGKHTSFIPSKDGELWTFQ